MGAQTETLTETLTEANDAIEDRRASANASESPNRDSFVGASQNAVRIEGELGRRARYAGRDAFPVKV